MPPNNPAGLGKAHRTAPVMRSISHGARASMTIRARSTDFASDSSDDDSDDSIRAIEAPACLPQSSRTPSVKSDKCDKSDSDKSTKSTRSDSSNRSDRSDIILQELKDSRACIAKHIEDLMLTHSRFLEAVKMGFNSLVKVSNEIAKLDEESEQNP